MKRFAFILLAVLSLFLLVSCNNEPVPTQDEQPQEVKNPACAEIAASVTETFSINADDFDYYNFADSEKQLDSSTVSLFYGSRETGESPDFSHVTDYYVMIPITTSATEIGIFKVDDAANVEDMKQYFANRASARAITFAAYNEAEAKKAENVLISAHGNYVWYIMTDENSEIENTILKAVK